VKVTVEAHGYKWFPGSVVASIKCPECGWESEPFGFSASPFAGSPFGDSPPGMHCRCPERRCAFTFRKEEGEGA
jgi:hypothetical protein